MVVLNYLKGRGYEQAWRQSFYIFGIPGLLWVVAFALWFRDNPRDHPGVNAAEKELLAPNAQYASGHGKVPWGLLVSSLTAWMLWAQYFFVTYVWYFYITWFPDYLKRQYSGQGYDETYLTQVSCAPLFFGGFGCMFSGFITKRMAASIGLKLTRRLLATLGMLGTMGCLVFVALSDLKVLSPMGIGLALGAASMFSDFAMPCSWGACMDVGGRFAGTFSGSMNMMGNFAGFLCPVVIGYVSNNWNLVFWTMAGAALLAALCWLLIDPVTPLEARGTSERGEFDLKDFQLNPKAD
jgi:MFS family permease